MDFIWEALERAGHEEVRQAVKDRVHLDPLAGLLREGRDEASTHLVILPDKPAEKDPLPCPLDLVEHRLVQIDAVREELQPVVPTLQLYFGLVHPREPLLRSLPSQGCPQSRWPRRQLIPPRARASRTAWSAPGSRSPRPAPGPTRVPAR